MIKIHMAAVSIQELYGIYYCKKCGCKIDTKAPHPMLFVEKPTPFHFSYPLCETHAKEIVDLDLSKGEVYCYDDVVFKDADNYEEGK